MLKDKRGGAVGACGTASCRTSAEALARAFNYRLWPCPWAPKKSAAAGEGAAGASGEEDEEFFEASPSPEESEGGVRAPVGCHRSAATEAGREKLYELLQKHAADDATDVFYDVSEDAPAGTCDPRECRPVVVTDKPKSVIFTNGEDHGSIGDDHGAARDGGDRSTLVSSAGDLAISEVLCVGHENQFESDEVREAFANGLDSSITRSPQEETTDDRHQLNSVSEEEECEGSPESSLEKSISSSEDGVKTSGGQFPSAASVSDSGNFVDVDLSSNVEFPSSSPEETGTPEAVTPAESCCLSPPNSLLDSSQDSKDKEISIEVSGTNSPSPLSESTSPSASRLQVFEEARPFISRSTSLKTGKTPPGTPGRKKIVRFADVLGLDLESIRHVMTGDIPVVPSSAYAHLDLKDLDLDSYKPIPRTVEVRNMTSPCWNSLPDMTATLGLHPAFAVPGDQPDFLDRVRGRGVCLESVLVSGNCVQCTCRVVNYGFHKRVTVRYTDDDWASSSDVDASYVPGSSRDGTDKFRFSVFLNASSRRVQFAIKYAVNGREYWDNNGGQNYCLSYRGHESQSQSQEPGSPWSSHQFW